MKLKIFAIVFALLAIAVTPMRAAWAQSGPTPDLSGNNPHWIEDPTSQCWIYNPNSSPPPGLSVTWSGHCGSSLAQGSGTLSYFVNGSIVESDTGTFHDGVIRGSGQVVDFLAGGAKAIITTRYDEFATGVPVGQATYIDSDGNSHLGNWQAGTFSGPSAVMSISNSDGEWTLVLTDDVSSDQTQQQASNGPTTQDYVNAVRGAMAQGQQDIDSSFQQMQAIHNQEQQELALRNAQELATRNQQEVPAPGYIPPPPPVVAPPDQQVASNNDNTAAPATQCVSYFYNSNVYGWFFFKDNCSFPITIAAQLRNSPGSEGGVSTVYPGESGNVNNGNSGQNAEEVNQGGGFAYAACPQGYEPFDSETNQLWGKNTTSFYCKPGYVP